MNREMINISLKDDEKQVYDKLKENCLKSGGNWNQFVKRLVLVGSLLELDKLEDWQEISLRQYKEQVDKHKLFSMSDITFYAIEEYITFGKMSYLIKEGCKRDEK